MTPFLKSWLRLSALTIPALTMAVATAGCTGKFIQTHEMDNGDKVTCVGDTMNGTNYTVCRSILAEQPGYAKAVNMAQTNHPGYELMGRTLQAAGSVGAGVLIGAGARTLEATVNVPKGQFP